MDEIIAAVRACPSGALSFAWAATRRASRSTRSASRRSRSPRTAPTGSPAGSRSRTPTATRSGGTRAPRWSTTASVAVATRGTSRSAGRHWQIGFRDPVPDPEQEPTLFEWAGGFPALTRMTRIFYGKYVPQDPLRLRCSRTCPPTTPSAWPPGWARCSEAEGLQRGLRRLRTDGLPAPGQGASRGAAPRWVELLSKSADDAMLPADPEWRAAFVAYLEWGSRIGLENSQPGAHPPPHMPVPRWWWSATRRRAGGSPPWPPRSRRIRSTFPARRACRFEQHVKPLFRERDRQSMRRVRPLVARRRRRARGRDSRSPPGRDDALRRCLARRAGRGVQALAGLWQGRVEKELRNVRSDRHLESRQPQARPRPCFEPGCVRADGLADRILVVGAHPSVLGVRRARLPGRRRQPRRRPTQG